MGGCGAANHRPCRGAGCTHRVVAVPTPVCACAGPPPHGLSLVPHIRPIHVPIPRRRPPVSLISTTHPLVSFSSNLRNEASKSRRPGFCGSSARMSSMRIGRPDSVAHTRRCLKCWQPRNLSMAPSHALGWDVEACASATPRGAGPEALLCASRRVRPVDGRRHSFFLLPAAEPVRALEN